MLTNNEVPLAKILSQDRKVILSIPHDGEMSWMNDSSESDWANHYLATLTSQYEYNGAYIAFDSECLVSVNDTGYVTIEEYDTSYDDIRITCDNVSELKDLNSINDRLIDLNFEDDRYDYLAELHAIHTITSKPDFMMVEWY